MKLHQLLSLAALAALAGSAVAAEAAYDFVACTHGKRTPLEVNGDYAAFSTEGWGVVASSTTKEWENASTHCVGYLHVVAGKPFGKGVCKWVFLTGDTGIGEYEFSTASAPKFTWIAGTGRLKGISGGGTFKEVFSAKPVEPGTGQGCRRDWGKYTLPQS